MIWSRCNFVSIMLLFFSWVPLGKPSPRVATMGDDSEWMKLSIDQKCEHKVTDSLFLLSYFILSIVIQFLLVKRGLEIFVISVTHLFSNSSILLQYIWTYVWKTDGSKRYLKRKSVVSLSPVTDSCCEPVITTVHVQLSAEMRKQRRRFTSIPKTQIYRVSAW